MFYVKHEAAPPKNLELRYEYTVDYTKRCFCINPKPRKSFRIL